MNKEQTLQHLKQMGILDVDDTDDTVKEWGDLSYDEFGYHVNEVEAKAS
jgi:hypothetical protein